MLQFLILLLLLLLSALFSGSEVALFSLNIKNIEHENKNFSSKYIISLLNSPRQLLITILLGNTLFNVASSIVSVSLALEFAKKYNYPIDFVLVIQIIVLTIAVLLLGEITPKLWASKFPLRFAKLVSIPLYWSNIVLYPITKTLTEGLKSVFSKLKPVRKRTAILTSEIADLADLGVEKGTIEEEEQELIHGIVSFSSIMAREVMTPRVDITAVSVETGEEELIQIINESGHSRIPLYDESLDNILGIIYAKDMLKFVSNSNKHPKIELKKIARKAMFVPETKLISELFQEFKLKRMHIGIVVDEYGGTAGLISLEDILEEIVGEIVDEYDKEVAEIKKLDDSSYVVLGKTAIDEINELLGVNFSAENDDYDTVGGFIFNYAGTIPEQGYSFEMNGIRFVVKEIKNNRIEKVFVKILPEKKDEN